MPFDSYVLQSDEGYRYTGHTSDLKIRLVLHTLPYNSFYKEGNELEGNLFEGIPDSFRSNEAREVAKVWHWERMDKSQHRRMESAKGGIAR